MMTAKTKPADDLEAALEAARAPAKNGCIVAQTIAANADKAEVLNRYVMDLTFGADRLASVLKGRGIAMSPSRIRAHRRQDCPCFVRGVR